MSDGDVYTVKKISEAEFILYIKKEIPDLFAAAITEKSHEKIADLLEMINNACDVVGIDWYECSKLKGNKRWEHGKYNSFVAKKIDVSDSEA